MKKLYLIFLTTPLLAAFAGHTQTSQSQPAALSLKAGDQLIYEVNAGGETYHFNVTVKKLGKDGIDFDYSMPEKANTASISIGKEAVSNARIYYNYFNGRDQSFTDKSTVWLSQANFTELQTGTTGMDMGSGQETFRKKEELSFTISSEGKQISVNAFHIDNEKAGLNSHQLWILNNGSNPLILKMNLGWTIELKEIKTAE